VKYVVDIDGTICKEIGDVIDRKPYTNRIDKINSLYDKGHTIVYMTARGLKSGRGEEYYRPITEQQLKKWGCKYHELQFKLHDADLFIDDKSVNSNDFFESNIEDKTVSVVIPARYKSTRFPGKPIVEIDGIPMVIRVAQQATKAVGKENVYIATESGIISDLVYNYDYNVILTSSSCLTGTDRVAEASLQLDSDIIVNVQGDEPMVNPDTILKVIEEKKKFPNSMITAVSRVDSREVFDDKNIVKFVFDEKNNLLYTSRSGIPGNKNDEFMYGYSHVAVYAFNKEDLTKFYHYGIVNGKSKLEWIEDVEILRFLEIGHNVKIVEVSDVGWSVDIPSDVKKVERLLKL
tara:strand:+ start:1535 stop:2578 length:1044 start_codon:yes stop_codon:yes gene_type:complete